MSGQPAAAHSRFLGTRFVRDGSAVRVIANERYAFAVPRGIARAGRLFTEGTRRVRTVAPDGCDPTGSEIFGGVLAFDCWSAMRSAPQIYSIATGMWRSVPLAAGVDPTCGDLDMCGVALTDDTVPVGTLGSIRRASGLDELR